VLMNLVVNARDAMPRGGHVTVETANVALDASYAARHADVHAGPYVMLAVSDTGTGMDTETQARVFEPFFTTKGPGSGTGLGLATVYGIVKQSGGYIWAYSELGQGTSFKIYLPEFAGPATDSPPLTPPVSPRGQERILIVEDEGAVRRMAGRALTAQGYSVLEAEHGADALEVLARADGPVDLVLTDVVMPILNGRELAERLAAERPQLRILFMSGYTDDDVVRRGLLDPGAPFLQKPFVPADLARKVREVLDAP
jgi:two-component system, cell cycle sensor histidine kinase and response regulator CckA